MPDCWCHWVSWIC